MSSGGCDQESANRIEGLIAVRQEEPVARIVNLDNVRRRSVLPVLHSVRAQPSDQDLKIAQRVRFAARIQGPVPGKVGSGGVGNGVDGERWTLEAFVGRPRQVAEEPTNVAPAERIESDGGRIPTGRVKPRNRPDLRAGEGRGDSGI